MSKVFFQNAICAKRLPIALYVAAFLILVFVKVNQYSLGMYGIPKTDSFWGGVDRPIRSDEWYVRIPWLLHRASNGFGKSFESVGIHNPSVIYDLPVKEWAIALKPHLIPYLLFDIERAISVEWWFLVLGTGCSVYVLLITLGVKASISAPLSLILIASPGLHWWTITSHFSTLLYASLATSVMLSLLKNKRSKVFTFFLGVIAGWLYSCAVVALYPPFQIPFMMTLFLIFIVYLKHVWEFQKLRLLFLFSPTFFIFISLSIWFLLKNLTAIESITQTIYPGQRVVNSGGQNFASVFGVPFDSKSTSIISGVVNSTNQSENASSFLIATPVVVLTWFGYLREANTLAARVQKVLVAWLSVMMAWMFMPLPSFIGSVTLLNRVPPERIKPTLILVSVLILAIHLQYHHNKTSFKKVFYSLLVFLVITIASGFEYTIENEPLPELDVLFLSILWILPVGFVLLTRSLLPLWIAAAVSITTVSFINPIRTDIRPMVDNPLVQEVERIDPFKDKTWLTFSGTAQVRGLMTSTGARVLSSVSPYPDRSFWNVVDPEDKYIDSWNRYGHVHFIKTSKEITITSPQSDVIEIALDPCSVGSSFLSKALLIESSTEAIPCARVISSFDFQDTTWFILQRN